MERVASVDYGEHIGAPQMGPSPRRGANTYDSLVLERKMLREIKQRAERLAAAMPHGLSRDPHAAR